VSVKLSLLLYISSAIEIPTVLLDFVK